jgi:hypothetical protein
VLEWVGAVRQLTSAPPHVMKKLNAEDAEDSLRIAEGN